MLLTWLLAFSVLSTSEDKQDCEYVFDWSVGVYVKICNPLVDRCFSLKCYQLIPKLPLPLNPKDKLLTSCFQAYCNGSLQTECYTELPTHRGQRLQAYCKQLNKARLLSDGDEVDLLDGSGDSDGSSGDSDSDSGSSNELSVNNPDSDPDSDTSNEHIVVDEVVTPSPSEAPTDDNSSSSSKLPYILVGSIAGTGIVAALVGIALSKCERKSSRYVDHQASLSSAEIL